jgi:hypothetical protein
MLYPLVKERVGDTKIMSKMYLLKKEAHTRTINIGGNDGKFLAGYFLHEQEHGAEQDNFMEVTQGKIKIYNNKSLELEKTFDGLEIYGAMLMHQKFLYTISHSILKPDTICDEEQGGVVKPQPNWRSSPSGFYVYDVPSLLEGKVERYKIAAAIGG